MEAKPKTKCPQCAKSYINLQEHITKIHAIKVCVGCERSEDVLTEYFTEPPANTKKLIITVPTWHPETHKVIKYAKPQLYMCAECFT